MEELRALRAQTLELEGQQVSSSNLYDVLQQFIKDNPITEEKKGKDDDLDKLEEDDGLLTIGEKIEGEEGEGDAEGEGEGEKKAEQKVITEDDVRRYYEQAYESVDRLIAVRYTFWNLKRNKSNFFADELGINLLCQTDSEQEYRQHSYWLLFHQAKIGRST